MNATPARKLTVAALASQVGMHRDTIRYYERVGLLPPPARTSANYRRYDTTAIDRLRFIQGTKRLGLRLREIRELLELRDTGACPCAEATALLRQHVADIDREIARLSSPADRTLGDDRPHAQPGLPRPDPGNLATQRRGGDQP